MELGNDNALRAIDNEGAIVGHQRNLTKEDLFFLDVANRQGFRFRILVINGQPDLHLEGHAITHAALLALLLVVFVLQTYRFSTVFTKLRTHVVEGAAFVTEGFARGQWIYLDRRTAGLTVCAQVI